VDVAKVRDEAPPALAWTGRVLAEPPLVIVGGMSAGYSGTPQARKLGLKAGQRVALDEPPPGWRLLEPPDGLRAPDPDGGVESGADADGGTDSGTTSGADGGTDLIIAFFRAESDILERLPGLARRVFPAGAIWAAWPRRAAGHVSDITDHVVRARALELGLVDVKVAAIDEDWSGLRLVWRVANR